MTKRSFVFLLAAVSTLSGGLSTLRGARTGVRLIRQKLDPVIRPATDVQPSPERELEPSIFTSRMAAVLVAAAVFGSGAYFGLGGSESVDAGAPSVPSSSPSVAGAVQTTADTSIRDGSLPHKPIVYAKAVATPAPDPAPVAVAAAKEAPQPASDSPAQYTVPEDGFEAIVCSKPWPCDQAIAVASCESGLDRNGRLDGNWATNGNNYGLFQINGVHANLWPDFYESWMDPVKNIEWAYELWSTSGGWRPWSCQP